MSEWSLTDAGFEGEWIAQFIEIAVENIIPPFVEIRGTLTLTVETKDGVLTIREALLAAEELSSEEQEIEVNCFYDGSPEYRIELKAPDFKTAEDTWTDAIKATVSVIENAGGTALAYREWTLWLVNSFNNALYVKHGVLKQRAPSVEGELKQLPL